MEGAPSHNSTGQGVTYGCQTQEIASSVNMELEDAERDSTNASNKDMSVRSTTVNNQLDKFGNRNSTEDSYIIDKSAKTQVDYMNTIVDVAENTKHLNLYSSENLDSKYRNIKGNTSLDSTFVNVQTSDVSEIAREKSGKTPYMSITWTNEPEKADNKGTSCSEISLCTKNRTAQLEKSENIASTSNIQAEISEGVSDVGITRITELRSIDDVSIKISENSQDKNISTKISKESQDTQDKTSIKISEEAQHKENTVLQTVLESEKQSSDQMETTANDDYESDEPSEDVHTTKLGKICRICGKMTVKYDGPKKGVPKHEVIKHVKKVWNVDISDENNDIYPVNVCVSCERKIKRLYSKICKRKKCEMFRQKPAEFVEHTENDCAVCLLRERTPSPPCLPSCELSQQETVSVNEVDKCLGSDMEVRGNSICQTLLESRRNSTRKRSWEGHGVSLKSIGCQTELNVGSESMTGLEEHDYTQDETLSQFLVLPKKLGGRTPYQKQSLSSVNAKYIRQDRLKPLIAHIDKFCQLHKEDKIDAMFFLLMQTLRDAGDRARENLVLDIWCKKNNVGMSLTEEECLAKRILLKQTKDQYRKEYSYYKEKLEKSVLKPPFIIDRLEKTYFPEHLEYFVTDGELGPVIYQHEKSTHPSYFTITDCQDGNSKGDSARAGVMGVRWRYFDAVAKTLEELSHSVENEIQDLDDDACIKVDMFDYCEEKRDLTNFTDKNDSSGNGRGIQSKMITYFFGIQSMVVLTENTVTLLYKSDPNTVQFRPLMKALVAEGGALHPAVMAIDEERAAMTDKIFHITLPSGMPLRFMVFFTNSSLEIRKDYRNISGLTLSSFKKVPVVINRYGSICLELKRSWLASSPRLVNVSRVTNSRTKCSRCGEQGHNVRKCSLPSDSASGDTRVQPKKRKKQRTAPSPSYSTVGQTTQIFSKDSKMLDLGNHHQHQHHHQHPNPQSQQESQETLAHLAPGATSIDQNSGIIRSDDQILWTCPSLGNTPSHIGTSTPQGTQVLIPTHIPSSNADYQSVLPQRTHAQISQQPSAPLYVWTYTVVQPQQGPSHPQQLSLVHHQPAQTISQHTHQQLSMVHQQSSQQESSQHHQQLSVVHQQPTQQEASQQHQQLSVVHQQPPQQEASQQHQQLSVTHQQPAQPGTPEQHQQLSVVHQQSGHQSTQQSQHLSVIHQQSPQQPPPQQSQLSVVHPQQIQCQSQQQSATPQINLIVQQASHPQTVRQSQLSVVHSQSTSQPQSQQLSVVHQQSTSQPHSQQLPVVHSQSTSHPQSQQLSVVHQQSTSQSQSQQLSVVHSQSTPQQLSVVHQQTTSQQLTVVHPQTTSQPQSQQPLSLVHQQASQSANLVHQQGPQSQPQTTQSEPSSPQQRLIHPQTSELQPIIGQW
ncbi:uncharacterized protein [Cherax quadricarinatus]|uniref:uncharacterized protein n=1 Tax=Cherax quadricarinatus TaxID=27406 RepID=UPI00387EDE71